MKIIMTLITLLSCIFIAAEEIPNTIIWDGAELVKARNAMKAGDAKYIALRDNLIERADKLIPIKIKTVTDKSIIPPSGDKKDFISWAIYWWPNPKSADGKPYIRKDGRTNPESKKITDNQAALDMLSGTSLTALAGFYTGDKRYFQKSSDYLRAWFVNPETRMNPNFNYGEIRPGHDEDKGNYTGIILFAFRMQQILDSAALLKGQDCWSENDQKELERWMTEYLQWLNTSELALEAKMSTNNHATYFASQMAMLYTYIGKPSEAKAVLEEVFNRAFPKQFGENGIQEHELGRTLSFSYSTMNLRGWVNMAKIGNKCGFDAWKFKDEKGIGLYEALSFYIPFADPASKWPYQEIRKLNRNPLWELMVAGAQNYADKKFYEALVILDASPGLNIDKLYFPYELKQDKQK